MKYFILFALTFSMLSSHGMLSYDRGNVEIERILGNALDHTGGITPKPVASEARALYELGHLKEVGLAVAYSNTMRKIQKEAGEEKLAKYSLVAPLKIGQLHIVVPKNSPIKTFHDLDGHSVNVGVKNGPLHLLSNTIMKKANIFVRPYFFDSEAAFNGMMSGEGVGAVLVAEPAPVSYLKKNSKYIRFINLFVPYEQERAVIKKELYSTENDVSTIATDLLLIGKNSSLAAIQSPVSNLIDNLIAKNESLCQKKLQYGVGTSNQFVAACEKSKKSKKDKRTKGKKTVKKEPIINLNKPINSVEDIEIYSQALLNNKAIGGLNKATEKGKLKKLVKFIKDNDAKVIIKSYSNEGNAYLNAKKVSKILRKEGISRGKMIIKAHNESTFAPKSSQYEAFLNTRVQFELY